MYKVEHGTDSKNSNKWEERQRGKKKEQCNHVSLPFMVYKLILASSDEYQAVLTLKKPHINFLYLAPALGILTCRNCPTDILTVFI